METAGPAKVSFRLTQDENGYPPVAVESVWAQPGVSSGEFVIDNIPFFSREATLGDTVRAKEEAGHLWFEEVLQRSLNSLVRIVFFDRTAVERVGGDLSALGCSTEYMREHNLLAVNIPPSVKLQNVQEYLQRETARKSLDYEEPILRQ